MDMDPLLLPVDRFCNRILTELRSRMDEEAWRSFEERLWLPPPGVEAEIGPWSKEEMAASFLTAEREMG